MVLRKRALRIECRLRAPTTPDGCEPRRKGAIGARTFQIVRVRWREIMQQINKRPSRRRAAAGGKGSTDGLAITVEVINNCAFAHGQETAQARVWCNGQKPPPGQTYQVNFTLDPGSLATFVDTRTQTTSGITDSNGVVSKSFTDPGENAANVTAAIAGGGPSDTAPFAFFNQYDIPGAMSLELLDNGAGSGDYITAQVTVNDGEGNKPPESVTINYQVEPEDVGAQFYSMDYMPLGQTATAATDQQTGIASLLLKSPAPEIGKATATWNDPELHPIYQTGVYYFTGLQGELPEPQLAFNPLTTLSDDTKEIVECDVAPAANYFADHTESAGFKATAIVTNKADGKPWTLGGNAYFTFGASNANTEVPDVQLPPDQDETPDKSNPGSYFVTIESDGTASLLFYDINIQDGTVGAYVPAGKNNLESNSDSKSFSFRHAWHGVASAVIEFNDGSKSAWIYGNGRQQAQIQVTLNLVDKNNKPLMDSAMPSLEEVYAAVKLLNYTTGEILGDGSSSMWSYSRNYNGWQRQTPVAGSQQLPRGVASGNDGMIQLTYYVACNGPGDIKLGLVATPTGGQVLKTDQTDATTQLPIGKYQDGSPPQYYDFHESDWTGMAALSAKTPPVYDAIACHRANSHQTQRRKRRRSRRQRQCP
jgi:hypothetical protein